MRYSIERDLNVCTHCGHAEMLQPEELAGAILTDRYVYPDCWIKGQLLNVRASGDTRILTLREEEFDPSHPERALVFESTYDTQAFVSWWYARETFDPLAQR